MTNIKIAFIWIKSSESLGSIYIGMSACRQHWTGGFFPGDLDQLIEDKNYANSWSWYSINQAYVNSAGWDDIRIQLKNKTIGRPDWATEEFQKKIKRTSRGDILELE